MNGVATVVSDNSIIDTLIDVGVGQWGIIMKHAGARAAIHVNAPGSFTDGDVNCNSAGTSLARFNSGVASNSMSWIHEGGASIADFTVSACIGSGGRLTCEQVVMGSGTPPPTTSEPTASPETSAPTTPEPTASPETSVPTASPETSVPTASPVVGAGSTRSFAGYVLASVLVLSAMYDW
eukprot:CAMPEP_0204829734 /NCGR_PEP_ID=MMETSP1346-20131115/8057_1 /ASSEMBLY_ACC=CAM_ASM_000771 /TAXON_ID=215587 /ORGANISM="Aplanochytrium stocchinoi, Strain GSBS06" /LENGTH=179 /DNA_ID=CAMNT_0051959777 /DNA_START=290 /DNA_END=829 /DNA_ORIENTATION=+